MNPRSLTSTLRITNQTEEGTPEDLEDDGKIVFEVEKNN
jgi:hypothetical protein